MNYPIIASMILTIFSNHAEADKGCNVECGGTVQRQDGTSEDAFLYFNGSTVNLFQGDVFELYASETGCPNYGYEYNRVTMYIQTNGSSPIPHVFHGDTTFTLSASGTYQITFVAPQLEGLPDEPMFKIVQYAPAQAAWLTMQTALLLEGPYNSVSQLMSDTYRTNGQLLNANASTGFSTCVDWFIGQQPPAYASATVLSIFGTNAPVDWVLIELRDPIDPSIVLTSRPGLVQRDGDIMNGDGTTPFRIRFTSGNYYVAVRHRNHLGTMTASPISLSTVAATIDFRSTALALYGTEPTKIVGTKRLLWAGNAVCETGGAQTIKYTGAGNDRDPVLTAIGGVVPTNTVSPSYWALAPDVNLDGQIKYTGLNNDRDPILQAIGGTVPTNTRVEQIPYAY